MAIQVTFHPELADVLTKMAAARIQHPSDLTTVFALGPIKLEIETVEVGGVATPAITLSPTGTHTWPYFSEPDHTFDDRILG